MIHLAVVLSVLTQISSCMRAKTWFFNSSVGWEGYTSSMREICLSAVKVRYHNPLWVWPASDHTQPSTGRSGLAIAMLTSSQLIRNAAHESFTVKISLHQSEIFCVSQDKEFLWGMSKRSDWGVTLAQSREHLCVVSVYTLWQMTSEQPRRTASSPKQEDSRH